MAVEDFLGIPYRAKGRDRTGTDCLGLVLMYLHSIGKYPPDTEGYLEDDWRKDAEPRLDAWLSRHAVRVEQPEAGDLVVFRLPGHIIHFGVMVDSQNILHILENRPSLLTPLRRCRRLVGVYRIK